MPATENGEPPVLGKSGRLYEVPQTLNELFEHRLVRSKRYDEYKRRLDERLVGVASSDGPARGTITKTLQREYGLQTMVMEVERFKLWVEDEDARIMEQEGKLDPDQTLSEVLKYLPPVARTDVELDWVRSHPAMMRFARSGGDPVLITAEDLLTEGVMECPSKSAANMLQHWANDPAGFQKLLMSEQKKQQGNGTTTARKKAGKGEPQPESSVEDPGVDEIRRMIQING